MAENSLPEKPEALSEEELSDTTSENFTLSNFKTAAVFGDSPARFTSKESFPVPPQLNASAEEQTLYSKPPASSPTIGTRLCSSCNTPNPLENLYCAECGLPFTLPRIFFNEDSAQNTKAVNKRKYDDQTVPLALHSTPYYEKAGADSEITPRFYELGNILENRYRIINYLGQGGFGDIYAIENIDSYFSDIQVLKLVHSKIEKDFSVASPEALRDSYRSQYKAWKILSEKEPNFIVRLFDVQVIARRVGILMEWMEGGTLLEMVEAWGGKPQTQEQLQHLIKLFIQACRSLNIIHKHNLIHRDVKPQNFLLDAARQKCKLCDFELLNKEDEDIKEIFTEVFSSNTSNLIVGTLRYMSPESFDGKFSVKSDIFALGVTFYFLLSGEYPFSDGSEAVLSILNAAHRNEPARPLTELNSLVSPSLDRLVQWCLEFNPEQRPDSVADLINRLLQLGISDEESNFSPVNLARLLLNHLSPIDLEWLIDHLRKRGFRSMSELPEYQQQDMIEEYCYTTSPFEILKEHCGGASLYAIAEALKIKKEKLSRDDLIKEIVTTLGFLPGRKQAHGLESIRRALESSRIKIESAETIAECRGHLDHAFAEIERAVNLLIIFYGQTLYGKGLNSFLLKKAKSKPIEKMTFGEKVGALREICMQKPNAPLPERVERIFNFPLISPKVFTKLNNIVTRRNQLFHNRASFTALHTIQISGQEILRAIVEIVGDFASNPYAPRVVQITSLQNDVFGRHFYEGYDEKGKKEKIFTTFGLQVGQLYWFVPLTNPARINPLIFPFDEPEEKLGD